MTRKRASAKLGYDSALECRRFALPLARRLLVGAQEALWTGTGQSRAFLFGQVFLKKNVRVGIPNSHQDDSAARPRLTNTITASQSLCCSRFPVALRCSFFGSTELPMKCSKAPGVCKNTATLVHKMIPCTYTPACSEPDRVMCTRVVCSGPVAMQLQSVGVQLRWKPVLEASQSPRTNHNSPSSVTSAVSRRVHTVSIRGKLRRDGRPGRESQPTSVVCSLDCIRNARRSDGTPAYPGLTCSLLVSCHQVHPRMPSRKVTQQESNLAGK